MERIVVGVDSSEAAHRALDWALDEARRRQAVVEVVHAWHPSYVGASPWAGVPIDPDMFESAAREVLDRIIEAADTEGLAAPAEPVLVWGSAAKAILEAAKGADLVVVGSRGHGGFTGLLLGSVSSQVVHHASCPTVVVPSKE